MSKEITEILEIHNFLSIENIKWDIKRFNIITGDMGVGKSLCIKLVQFFEDVISELLIMPYEKFLAHLESMAFFNFLIEDFKKTFVLSTSNSKKFTSFKITYTFGYKESLITMTITGSNETDVIFESSFLEKLLTEWNEIAQKKGFVSPEKITPDGFRELKLSLYSNLLKRFGECFPMATIFVPASRAALAFSSNHTDNYLKEYKEVVDVLPQFISRNQKIINTILKAKILIEDSFLFLESDDGRKVPISKASSGQQEIVYVLMLLDRLGNFGHTYGHVQSLFIEEPSAHLFPMEQKQTIELIALMFDYLKDNGSPVRFFITTHSPYVLNVINNMMRKGSLIKQNTGQENIINAKIGFPSLFTEDVSAIFINEGGTITDMIDYDEEQIIPEKIRDISFSINNDIINLDNLSDELNQASREIE
jgi:predicted ATPase